MTSTPNEPRLYDVWLMWVEFPDHPGIGKPRPVVITEVDGDLVSGIVAKITATLIGMRPVTCRCSTGRPRGC